MAIGSIGGINVKVTADIDGFQASLNKATAKVSEVSTKIRSSANEFAKWGAAGVAAATAVGTAMVKTNLETIDALAKTADRLGLTTEALAGLRRSAELTGASTETLDMALQRMTRRVAEAAQGTGEAKAAIAELGLSAESLAQLSPDEQFKVLADAMSEVTNQGDRVRIAMKLFDSEGVKLVNTLALGSEGLNKQAEEALALGVAFNRVDAAKVEAANDALFTAGQAVDGLATQFTIALAPVIEGIANDLTEMAKSPDDFAASMEEAISKAASVLGVFADGLRGIEVIYKGLEVGAWAFASVITEMYAKVGEGAEAIINGYMSILNSMIEASNSLLGTSIEPIEKYSSKAVSMMKQSAEEVSAALDGAIDSFNDSAMAPLPSQQIEEWLAKVKEKSQEAADAVGSVIGGGNAEADSDQGAGATDGGESEGTTSDGLPADLQSRIDAVKESLMTEQQLKAQAFLDDLEAVDQARALDLENMEYYNDLERQLVEAHQQELIDIEDKAAKARESITQAEYDAKMAMVSSTLSGISSLMNTESRKMFEIGKAAALANAGIAGVESAIEAWRSGMETPGPYAPLVAAAYTAASIAKTTAMISQIRSASYGSSSSSTSYSSGVATTSTTSAESSSSSSSSSQNISISLTGGDDAGRSILSLLNATIRDGGTLITT